VPSVARIPFQDKQLPRNQKRRSTTLIALSSLKIPVPGIMADIPTLPAGKRLWQTDEELRVLEGFALAEDRALAVVEGDGAAGGFHDQHGSQQRRALAALEALQAGDTTKAERLASEMVTRGDRSWASLAQEISLSAALVSLPGGGEGALKKIRSALHLTLNEHEQDPSFKGSHAGGDGGTQPAARTYPSALSPGALEESLGARLSAKLQSPKDLKPSLLTPQLLHAVLSNGPLVEALRSRPGGVQAIRGMLDHGWMGGRHAVVPGIVGLVAADMESRATADKVPAPFGSTCAERSLTIEQMRELMVLHPPVLGSASFLVQAAKLLHESACADSSNPTMEERMSFLTGLGTILDAAPASANWLRAQHLASWLHIQRESAGWAEPQTLARLLSLPWTSPLWAPQQRLDPRRSIHENRIWVQEQDKQMRTGCDEVHMLADLPGLHAQQVTAQQVKEWMIDAVMAAPDEDSAEQLFADGGLFSGLLPSGDSSMVLAAGMLLSGKGSHSRWASTYASAGGDLRSLAAATELGFSPDCRRSFPPAEQVVLKADVKGCQSILVKVFEVNAWNYCRETMGPVQADIEIEGLGATHSFTAPVPGSGPGQKMQRSRVSIAVPQLTGRRGVFVVELLGGGLACRALLRIGRLSAFQQPTVAGHSFTLFWEDGSTVEGARVWVDNAVYDAEPGRPDTVVVPFALENMRHGQAVLGCKDSQMGQLMSFAHKAESYQLQAGMFMDDEALVPQGQAPLAVWARLSLHGLLVPASMLRQVSLVVSVLDSQGTKSETTVQVDTTDLTQGNSTLFLREVVTLPEDPVSVDATLRGTVDLASNTNHHTGQPESQALSASHHWDVGPGSQAFQAPLHDVYLSRTPEGFVLSVKGRAGEAVPGALLALQPMSASVGAVGEAGEEEEKTILTTDGNGCISLGELSGFSQLSAKLRHPSSNLA